MRDSTIYDLKSVTIVEIMGRNAGWLTAAAALAEDEDCEGAAMICLPEIPFDPDHFIARVDAIQQQTPSLVVAVSEGVRIADGRYVCELAHNLVNVDAFGHTYLSGTAHYLSSLVAAKLHSKTRAVELSTSSAAPRTSPAKRIVSKHLASALSRWTPRSQARPA